MYGYGLNAATMDINIHQLQQDTTTTTTFTTTTTCTATTTTTTTTNNNNNNNTIAGLQIVDNLDLTGKGQIIFQNFFRLDTETRVNLL